MARRASRSCREIDDWTPTVRPPSPLHFLAPPYRILWRPGPEIASSLSHLDWSINYIDDGFTLRVKHKNDIEPNASVISMRGLEKKFVSD